MANGLMGLQDLLGGSSNATSGLFGGQSVFTRAPSRGQQRSRLLTGLISNAGSDPYSRLGAAFGGLIGMGARAGAEGLGIVDEPEEVKRNRAIREVQQTVSQRGLDPLDPGFGEFVAEEFQRRGFGDLATKSLLQARAIQSQFAPEPVETTIRAVGGTPRANALAERYPEIGQIEEGQEVFVNLLNGEFRGVETKSAPREDIPSRIEEYETALERGLIDENTSFEEYNRGRAGGNERRAAAPTETSLSPFAAAIDTNEEIKNRIESFVEEDPQATLVGIGIPFTGGRNEDAVDAVSLQVQQRALEIRNEQPELSVEQALNRSIDELNQLRSGSTTDTATGGPSPSTGVASPQNDPFAGRVNP